MKSYGSISVAIQNSRSKMKKRKSFQGATASIWFVSLQQPLEYNHLSPQKIERIMHDPAILAQETTKSGRQFCLKREGKKKKFVPKFLRAKFGKITKDALKPYRTRNLCTINEILHLYILYFITMCVRVYVTIP